MKTVLTFFAILSCTFSLKAQIIEDWTSPVVLTDSTSNNSNPVVVVLQDDLYMFYNKHDEPYREIWWRKISEPMSEEQILFDGWPEVDYRNPQILLYNFLIFECNIFDNYDLFGVRFDENGTVGDLFRLTNTEYDENSFYANNDYYSNICCWESEGSIYVAEPQISQDTLLLTDVETVDSVNCYDPVCQENYVAWRKVENNQSHIYYSRKTYPLYQWSEPDTIIKTNDNTNLSLSISVPEMGGGYNLCWQAEDKICFSELNGNYLFYPEIPGIENYYEPVAFNLLYVTDLIPELYSFIGEAGSIRDIYIADEYISNYILNISDDPYLNKNPRLFTGRGNYNYFEIINIWQTEMNGYDVLYGSFARYNVVIGNISKNDMPQLDIYPNPFSEYLNIGFTITEPDMATLEIFSLSGEKLFRKEIQGQPNTKQSISWNPKSEGHNLSEGVYLVKLTQGKSSVVRKVVYSE